MLKGETKFDLPTVQKSLNIYIDASKKMPGLFCIGEAVDVTGWLGGYNFQWAWASGVAAGEAV
jgi:predicted flavoprotein YhiN